VQAGERLVGVADLPGAGERAGQVGLFGQQVGGAVAQAARLDQRHLRVGGQQVGE
jgi:hypothetical protein